MKKFSKSKLSYKKNERTILNKQERRKENEALCEDAMNEMFGDCIEDLGDLGDLGDK